MNELIFLISIPLTAILLCACLPSTKLIRIIIPTFVWLYLIAFSLKYSHIFSNSSTQSVLFLPGLELNKLSYGFIILSSLVVACSLSYSNYYFAKEEELNNLGQGSEPLLRLKFFYISSLAFLLAVEFVFLCSNLGYLWIAMEASTLSAAPLVYFEHSKHSLEATWKYLIICSVGIAFALLGTVFIFASSQMGRHGEGVLDINELIASSLSLDQFLLRLGIIFALLGYGTKAGMFPLYSWLPDAYAEAPAPASAMLSGALLNCSLFGIWQISKLTISQGNSEYLLYVLTTFGSLTILAAGLLMIRQNLLKRLLAYSSIENVGIMLICIALNSQFLFFLQALNHSVCKVSLFLMSGVLVQTFGSKKLSQLRGLFRMSPLWSMTLIAGGLAISGAPPFGSFVSEIAILANCAQKGLWLVVICLLLGISLGFLSMMQYFTGIISGPLKYDINISKKKRLALIPIALILISIVLGTELDISTLIK